MLVPEILTLLETDLLDELTFVLDDLMDVDELTDFETLSDFWTLSCFCTDSDFETLSDKLPDDVSDTLFCTLSWTLFSAFATALDCTFPSTRCSALSATLFADLLALSTKPVAVFSILDYIMHLPWKRVKILFNSFFSSAHMKQSEEKIFTSPARSIKV